MTNLLSRSLALCLLLPLLLVFAAQAQNESEDERMEKQADIVQTAKDAGNFDTLTSALTAAELVETLKGEGPFTVFAPTDEAFSNLPEGTLDNLLKPENKEQLQSILKYHVVEGKAMASDVTSMSTAETLQGTPVTISEMDGTVTLEGDNTATVTKTDIEASNGVIHVIDTVLMPATTTAMNEDK
jgi:uncharacterized surface protein with fasciclin (FAS1) repeats